MMKWQKQFAVFIPLILTAYVSVVSPASAITAELAKKCRALAIKAHPSPIPGTKAKGAEKAQRDYFQQCIAKDGKMERTDNGKKN